MTKNNLAGNGRLLSLDALRGFDMMFIMGLSGIIISICALFPDGDTSWLAMQMSHVKWEGFHHHDTIFALFLFISGMTFLSTAFNSPPRIIPLAEYNGAQSIPGVEKCGAYFPASMWQAHWAATMLPLTSTDSSMV